MLQQIKSEPDLAPSRGIPEVQRDLYRLAHMPRLIWVSEIVDREARNAGLPDVLGEVLQDSTFTQELDMANDELTDVDRAVLGFRLGHLAVTTGPDHGRSRQIAVSDGALYPTAMPVSRP